MNDAALAPILYVEDEENDVVLLRIALRRAGVEHPLTSLADGAAALDYLLGRGEFADRTRHPFPCLVLLDLNLPTVAGFQVLRTLQVEGVGAAAPVIVFTSSAQLADQHKALYLGAADYITKPGTMDALVDFGRALNRRWLNPDTGPVP